MTMKMKMKIFQIFNRVDTDYRAPETESEVRLLYIFCDFILLVVYCYCAPSRVLHGLTSTLFASIARFNHVLLSFSLARLQLPWHPFPITHSRSS